MSESLQEAVQGVPSIYDTRGFDVVFPEEASFTKAYLPSIDKVVRVDSGRFRMHKDGEVGFISGRVPFGEIGFWMWLKIGFGNIDGWYRIADSHARFMHKSYELEENSALENENPSKEGSLKKVIPKKVRPTERMTIYVYNNSPDQ